MSPKSRASVKPKTADANMRRPLPQQTREFIANALASTSLSPAEIAVEARKIHLREIGRRRKITSRTINNLNRNMGIRSRDQNIAIYREKRVKKPLRTVSKTEAEKMLEQYRALIFKSVFEKEDKPKQKVTASLVRNAAKAAEIDFDELYAEARKIFVERLGFYDKSIYEKDLNRKLTKEENQAFFITFMMQQIRFRLLNYCRQRVAQKRIKEVPLEQAETDKIDRRRKSFAELLGIPQDFSIMEINDLFRLARLTDREKEIVRLIQEENSYREIEQQLPISKSRVGQVVLAIRKKLNYALKQIELENKRVGV